jgi:phosphoribosylformylglycinamidine synthase
VYELFIEEAEVLLQMGVRSAYAGLAGEASEDGPPALDLGREAALQSFVREAIAHGLVASAQDVSGGGLATALAECAMWGERGADLGVAVGDSAAVGLFGESPSRVVLSAEPGSVPALLRLAEAQGVPVTELGLVGGGRLRIELRGAGATGSSEERGSGVADALDVSLADLRLAWDRGLPRALGWED